MTSLRKYNGIEIDMEKISDFCKRNHIIKLSLFGSFIQGDFKRDSDIDVLVEFESEHVPGYFGLITMEEDLSGIFNGLEVDLRTPNDLSRYFRNEVIQAAEELYARS